MAPTEAAPAAKPPVSTVTSAEVRSPLPLASSARVLSRPPPEEEAKVREALSALTKPGADVMALLKAMRPSSAEYKSVWVGDAAKKLEDELGKQWDRNQEAAKPPKLDGRHPMIFTATTEEIAGGDTRLPGGYRMVVQHMQAGKRWWGVRYVDAAPPPANSGRIGGPLADRERGIAMDVFVLINGKVRFFPKAFRPLRDKTGPASSRGE